MHLPRSVFSRKQLDLFLWLLRANHVESVPSTKNMTTLNKILQGICGIETIAYDGRLGHRYHVNNLSQILAQVSQSFTVIRSGCFVLTLAYFTGNVQPQSPAKYALLC